MLHRVIAAMVFGLIAWYVLWIVYAICCGIKHKNIHEIIKSISMVSPTVIATSVGAIIFAMEC